MGFLRGFGGIPAVAVAGGLTSALYGLAGLRSERRAARRVAVIAWIALGGLHLFWTYEMLTFGVLLAWSTPWWLRIGALLLAAFVAATALRPSWRRARVPASLPAGVWIVGCLLGWLGEARFVRCDDVRRVMAEDGVSLVMATSSDIDINACREGDRLPVARYPRKLWESPDGARYVFTTQVDDPSVDPRSKAPGRLTGSVCEVAADGRGEPRCFGYGKAHGICEAAERDRLFVAA